MDCRLVRDQLDELTAVIDGLLVAVCAPDDPLPWERARHLLAEHVSRARARGLNGARRE